MEIVTGGRNRKSYNLLIFVKLLKLISDLNNKKSVLCIFCFANYEMLLFNVKFEP